MRLKASINPYFIDLSSVLDDNNRSDFRDIGHTGPHAQKDIAFALANFIYELVNPLIKPLSNESKTSL